MLKLREITKDYVLKGVPTVNALKGLSINFRRNEFVAILGPSGCGKTTLLNIIGGLDRYTTGDLIIEGKSTKDYTDRDWDTYRNHSIGFVFQSYNLISHQSILRNVELALTISGIKKDERKERAMNALKIVGLEGMEKKKPNQLSGGQMQRVAIARALVNNPEILLADEPTGALDSETSVQIMDLLKEVAADRLVIMVTHNPDLANQYANRIVTMKDGNLLEDSNPYEGETESELKRALEKKTVSKGNKEKTSMSFFTATGLSFFNLLSKLKRTILVTIAGSIGIIGVSSVLAVSHGVNKYIDHMQDDMLSRYPIEISEQSVDITSLMTGLANMNNKEISQFDPRTEVGLDSMINYLMEKYSDFTKIKTNDINDDLLDFVRHLPSDKVSAISEDYGLDMTNNIFSKWQRESEGPESEYKYMSLNGLTQMYIDELRTVEGFGMYAMYVDLFTDFMKQIPGEKDYILSQYDLIGKNSRYPESENEILLVVDENQTLTDLVYAQMGFYTEREFLNIARKAIKSQQIRDDESLTEEEKQAKIKELDALYPYSQKYAIDDILGKELMYYPHNIMWGESKKQISKKTADFVITVEFTSPLGSLKPGEHEFIFSLSHTDNDSPILSLDGSLTIDRSISIGVMAYRTDDIPLDPSNPFLGKWDMAVDMGIAKFPFSIDFISDAEVEVGTTETVTTSYIVRESTINGFMYPAEADFEHWEGTTVKIAGIAKKKENVQFGCLDRGVYYTNKMTKMMMRDAANAAIVNDLKNYLGSNSETEETYSAYVTYYYTSFKNGDKDIIYNVPGYAKALNTDFSSSLSSLISIMGTNNVDVDRAYLRSLSGLAAKLTANPANPYKFDDVPQAIQIYPKNFESKKVVTNYLDRWNEDVDITLSSGKTLSRDQRMELSYIDTIEIIVNVVNTLITAITIALVAFTSLSLVVSCFMIAVITYISTMERVKEIGIIRSLGGRKKDVSRLFIAECLIIGTGSGVFGVGITYLLAFIFNLSIMQFGVGNMAILTIPTALIMIGVSIFLNVISGLIPALKASSQDPVIALRTE